jgi:hypothetical protein
MPLFGLAVFVVVVRRAGPGRIAAVLASVDPALLVWAPVLVAAIAVARGLRWRYVAGSVGIPYGLWRATQVWMIGFFASSVTPAKSGDALRAVYLGTTCRLIAECLPPLSSTVCGTSGSCSGMSRQRGRILAATSLSRPPAFHRGRGRRGHRRRRDDAPRRHARPLKPMVSPSSRPDTTTISRRVFTLYDALRQYVGSVAHSSWPR